MPAFNYCAAIKRDNISLINDTVARNSVNDFIIDRNADCCWEAVIALEIRCCAVAL
jgi:hypothetical protein